MLHAPRYRRLATVLAIGLLFILDRRVIPDANSLVAAAPASVTAVGCGMAHCNPQLTGWSTILAPSAVTSSAGWHDTSVEGSKLGLGCASNGSIFACSFATNGGTPTVAAYDPSGQRLWTSSALDSYASDAAPLITAGGTVLATDNQYLVAFDTTGRAAWKTATPGGVPISPNLTVGNLVILATDGGPISAYSLTKGTLLGTLKINAILDINGQNVSGYFDTTNSPAISGNRVYLSTQFVESGTNLRTTYGRLYAIDVTGDDGSSSATLTPAWYVQFKAPSGASPVFIQDASGSYVNFDGDGLDPNGSSAPAFFGVKDLGTSGQLVWSHALTARAVASGAVDPRGGLWVYAVGIPTLTRLDVDTGAVLQSIRLASLIKSSRPLVPASAMTTSGNAEQPRMVVAVTTGDNSVVDVLGIDLSSSTLLWSDEVDQSLGTSSVPHGQFPLATSSTGQAVVAFTTDGNGVWGLPGQ